MPWVSRMNSLELLKNPICFLDMTQTQSVFNLVRYLSTWRKCKKLLTRCTLLLEYLGC